MRNLCTILCLAIWFNSNAQTDTLQLKYDHFTLSNGLDVIFQPDKNENHASVEFWIKNGTSIDSPEQYGLQHFFEHVMPYNKMDSILRYNFLNNYLKGSNAQVKKDFSRFYLKVIPEGIELALEIASGRLTAGAHRITERRVEHERKRVLAEINKNAKNPRWSAKGSLAIQEGTFGKGHPYAANGYGTIENNKYFTLDDFRKRYEEIIYAENIILFVVGNFDEVKVKNLVHDYFGKVKSKKKQLLQISKPVLQSDKSISMNAPHPKDSLNTTIFSWAIPKWELNDDACLNLLKAHLNNVFKTEKELTLGMVRGEAYVDMHKFAGQFYIEVKFSNAVDSTQVNKIVSDKVAILVEKQITEYDLKIAKKSEFNDIIEMQKALGFEWSRTELIGKGLLFHNNPNGYVDKFIIQQNLTAKQLKRRSRKWLSKKPFKIHFIANNL